jgi:hypothetical protein
MAYLESAVVVYLREIYYPEGFQFPFVEIPAKLLITEVGREAATMVMLFAYARSVSRNPRETMAFFMYNFGVWDIWYYVWLKILIDWPVSIMDWDILFLIPVPWIGPVLAPVIISFALISAGYIIIRREATNKPLKLTLLDWLLEIISGLIIIFSFLTGTSEQGTIDSPDYYSWWLFIVGLILGLVVFTKRSLNPIKT